MSVSARIEDARVLWQTERIEGAVIQILIAFAGTVRKRYPKKSHSDSLAFKSFIADEILKITNGPPDMPIYYQGKGDHKVEEIVYLFIRCSLIHEGSLPSDIELTLPLHEVGKPFGKNPEGRPYDTGIFNILRLYETLGFPLGWIWNLVRVVHEAAENGDEFAQTPCPVPPNYSFNAGFKLDYPDDHAERFPPNNSKPSKS